MRQKNAQVVCTPSATIMGDLLAQIQHLTAAVTAMQAASVAPKGPKTAAPKGPKVAPKGPKGIKVSTKWNPTAQQIAYYKANKAAFKADKGAYLAAKAAGLVA